MSQLGCLSCGKTNYDEVREAIRQAAKAAAVESGEAKAVYKDGTEYAYISAAYAYANGYAVIEVVSAYR